MKRLPLAMFYVPLLVAAAASTRLARAAGDRGRDFGLRILIG
jgi:hypothetical protein